MTGGASGLRPALMFTGIGLLGTLTAAIASFL